MPELVAHPEAFWSCPPLKGEIYPQMLRRFHEVLKPRSYFEIGVLTGGTLELARCASIAIDPDLSRIKPSFHIKPSCFLFQSTSDAFFRDHDPQSLLGGEIDMAFLDGMHWYEFLLRDFINVEKYCKANSVVFLHDCCPVDSYVGRRDSPSTQFKAETQFPEWWAGDVWKVVHLLKKYRKDLKIIAIDAAPTGLIAISQLDKTSRFLEENYFPLIAEVKNLTLAEIGDEYLASLNMVSTMTLDSMSKICREFWL